MDRRIGANCAHHNSTPFDRFLDALPDGGRRRRKQPDGSLMVCCPSHHDITPSLHVSEGDDGKVILYCHAGCKIEEILRDLNLDWADIRPSSLQSHESDSECEVIEEYEVEKEQGEVFPTAEAAIAAMDRRSQEKHSRIYWYHDIHGKKVMGMVRWDASRENAYTKKMRPISLINGQWYRRALPSPRPLYGQRDMLAKHQLVLVVEGEKTADAAHSLGFAAVTSSFGANSVNKTDWKPLAEHATEVVILPDNDEAGTNYTEAVIARLHQHNPNLPIRIVKLPGLKKGSDLADWLEKRRENGKSSKQSRSRLRKLIMSNAAITVVKHLTIEITFAEHEVIDAAAAALARNNNLYNRAGLLSRLVHDFNGPRIEPLELATIREELSLVARFFGYVRNQKVEKHAPDWCLRALAARTHWKGIRQLKAVTKHPVLLSDGSILSVAGYHAPSGLYSTCNLPLRVPEKPTTSHVKASVDLLLDLISDFPFLDRSTRSGWIAALLTLLSRHAFNGPSPMFLFDANTQGSGKSLLAELLCLLVNGEKPPIASFTNDPSELRKVITSHVIAGSTVVLFDNLVGSIKSAELDRAITGGVWSDRLLGSNKVVELPLGIVWLATGNNCDLSTDLLRRSCCVRLESQLENPEQRPASDFRHPLIKQHVLKNRMTLLSAAFTILRGYYTAGRPEQYLPNWGSFEEWSGLVRNSMVWAGLSDPGEARGTTVTIDPETAAIGELLQCWHHADLKQRGMTSGEFLGKLTGPEKWIIDAKAALDTLGVPPETRGAYPLGRILSRYKRRSIGGLRFDAKLDRTSVNRWIVCKVAQSPVPQMSQLPSRISRFGGGPIMVKPSLLAKTAREAEREMMNFPRAHLA
jgi:putative DNA primase/helicase